MNERYLDIVRMMLDRQLIDAKGVECGKVGDVELEGGPGELRIIAILTGPGVEAKRLPRVLQTLAKKIFGQRRTRVSWAEIKTITSQIKLRSSADQLGLTEVEQRLAHWLAKLPLSQ